MEKLFDAEEAAAISEFESKNAADGAVLADKMSKFVEIADGHATSGGRELWLYFQDEAKLHAAAKQLKADGYRNLEAFPSPESAPEQLAFSLIVSLHNADSYLYDNALAKIVSDMGINPVSVFDMHDGSFVVTLDEQSNMSKWSMFKAIHAKALKAAKQSGGIKPKPSIHKNAIPVTSQYLVEFLK